MNKLASVLLVLGLGLVGCGDLGGKQEPLVELSNEDAELVEVIKAEEEEGLDEQVEAWEEIDEETGKGVKVESTKKIKDGKVMSETLIREEIKGENVEDKEEDLDEESLEESLEETEEETEEEE